MISENISNVRAAVTKLIRDEALGELLLYSLEVKKSCTIAIEGRKNMDFYDTDDETCDVEEYIRWKDARDIFFQSIKGSRLPLGFRIVLLAGKKLTMKVIAEADTVLKASDVASLGINIYYDRNGMRVTDGTSLKVFTMDKSLERSWDDYVKRLISGFEEDAG